MNKFTIFTVILAVSVITVTVDLTARDYLKSGDTQTSAISAEQKSVGTSSVPATAGDLVTTEPANIESAPVVQQSPVEVVAPKPDPIFVQLQPPANDGEVILSNVTQDKIAQAGFTGVLSEKHFDGKIFELLDITKNPVSSMSHYEIFQDGANILSVTEIVLPDEIRALNLYILLQNKTKPYIDLSLNETNAYGDRSFYINHAKKPDEAFLTVKMGKRIYAFAYVKLYHPQLKQLISLLAQ